MKLALKIIAGIIALLLLAIIALVTLVSPNQFKPYIEKAAQEQGIALHMGDLGWALWPSLGVSLADVKVAATSAPTDTIAELDNASLMLAIKPLFKGEFQVDHIQVSGARIHLVVDKQGKGNWEALTQSKREDATAANNSEQAAGDSKPLNLEVDKISLQNSALNYRDDKTGQTINLQDINLVLSGVNTQGRAFDMQLGWLLELAEANAATLKLKGNLSNRITLARDFNQLQLDDGKLNLTLSQQGSADIALSYQLSANDLQGELSYQGQLQVQPLNLRQLLAALGTSLDTANSDALKQLTLSTQVQGNTQKVALSDLKITLDKTRFSGKLAVNNFATSAIVATLNGDSINVDDYLPTPVDAPATPAAASNSEDTPLPLDALRTLNADIQLTLDAMRVKKMALQDIKLSVKASNGRIAQQLSAKSYQGDIHFNSNTDARGKAANLTFDGGLKGFELAPLLQDLEVKNLDLSGAIQAQAQGSTQGASVNTLMDAMNATAAFSGAQVRLSPLNIEQKFCELVNLVTQNSTEVNWDSFTEMRELDGKIIWRDQVINLESFNAGVSQLLLASNGKINLASDKYEFKLPIKLNSASEAASLKGCVISSANYWVDRGLSLLRCKGSLGNINPLKDCGFDKSALADLTKDFAEYKIREKHGDKIEAAEQKVEEKKQELLDKASDKLSEKLGGGEAGKDGAKNLLNNLLNRKSGKAAASSEATTTPTESDE